MNKLQRFFKLKPHKVGIAFGGGALLGAAHIGVLEVFEREGIHPEIVTGTSVGAIIGAAYSAGRSADYMAQMIRSANWANLIKLSFPPSLGLFETDPMDDFIRTNIFGLDFSDLAHPFAAVACNILTGKRVVIQTGQVSEAIRASAAFPGIFAPIIKNDELLVDGGVVDNLPSEVAREMGADYIIAVDLSSRTASLRPPQNLVDLLFGVVNLMHLRSSQPDPRSIDCLIRPDVAEFNPWAFNDIDDIISRGRIAANQCILKLKSDLHV
jgi:NTE family protein